MGKARITKHPKNARAPCPASPMAACPWPTSLPRIQRPIGMPFAARCSWSRNGRSTPVEATAPLRGKAGTNTGRRPHRRDAEIAEEAQRKRSWGGRKEQDSRRGAGGAQREQRTLRKSGSDYPGQPDPAL